jgi:superoxide dismutase, Fe-Mn family
MKKLELKNLPYRYNELEPYMSKQQLEIHHTKHHATYVENANKLLEANEEIFNRDFSHKLSFNLGGAVLHSLFWLNLQPPTEDNLPLELTKNEINKNFGSFEDFKNGFMDMALSIQGSGWTALIKIEDKLKIVQIENHQNFFPVEGNIILILDCWEHAYYIDYQNNKKSYFENFFKLINWEVVENRLKK